MFAYMNKNTIKEQIASLGKYLISTEQNKRFNILSISNT